MREQCGEQCRHLFEEAAIANQKEDKEEAGYTYGIAIQALHQCLGIPSSPEAALDEAERWFSFFDWWNAARLLREGESYISWGLLLDLAESFSPSRSVVLGIVDAYGATLVSKLWNITNEALADIQGNNLQGAAQKASTAADIQYRLAVEKSGT